MLFIFQTNICLNTNFEACHSTRISTYMELIKSFLSLIPFSLLDARSCDSNPCLNGATCTNRLGDYACACLKGWTGKNCETGNQFQLRILVYIQHDNKLLHWQNWLFVFSLEVGLLNGLCILETHSTAEMVKNLPW